MRLIGHSTGAMVTLAIALRHPELVEDGLLIAPLFSGEIKKSGALARFLSLPVLGSASFGLMIRGWLRSPASFEIGLKRVTAADATIAAHSAPALDAMRRDLQQFGLQSLYLSGLWIGEQDLTDRLTDLAVPMQVILCQRDPVISVRHQLQLVAEAPMVDAVLIDTGHLPFLESPDVFAGLFRAWRTRPRVSAPAAAHDGTDQPLEAGHG